ncbi:hypothetical protein NDU88_007258 [Pleurodeles waltl]|uniref:Uncharacterized protein n=1 Tax=Pleurodeles waltl TaxID=8319 RepID=A0AAV7SSC9_PLEWA|nr:hypothetical protein NDU88_007258 [Pleurodeles waltl]
MDRILQEIYTEIGSLKTDLKSFIKEVKREVSKLGEWVIDLERIVDTRSKDQELMWRRKAALEEQCIELQAKQEDFENSNRCNKFHIRVVPRGAEGGDTMKFTMELLQTIRGDEDAPPQGALSGLCAWASSKPLGKKQI